MLATLVSFAEAQDWPRWRGENQDDKSTETGLLQTWPDEGPQRLWVADSCGLGYAGFSIVDGKLYTMGLEEDVEFALCLDATTGDEIWRKDLGDRYNNNWGDGPRSTPTVDEDRVYFMAAQGNLVCMKKDGSHVWTQSMESFGGAIPAWGYSESPTIWGDHIYCTPGGDQGAILALNKMTGEQVWQTDGVTSQAHYSSILVAEHEGKPQLIQLLVDRSVGVDPESGEVLWSNEWPGRVAVIPSPIYDSGKVYLTSGYGVGSQLFSIEDNTPVEVFRNNEMVNHHGGIVLHDGHVYGYSDGKGFICQSMETGDRLWNEKRKIKKGAVAYADGRFYFVEERSGDVILIEANTDGWEERGRFTLDPQTTRRKPQGRIWVHPVISDGKLYLRDQEYIMCYDIKASDP